MKPIARFSLVLAFLLPGCGDDARLPRPNRGQGPGTRRVERLPAESTARRQVVYLPVYSHTYINDSADPYRLSATVTVRNVDPRYALVLDSVRYHDSQGRVIRSYVEHSTELAPLGSVEYFVRPSDTRGGTGASVLVAWSAREPVSPPLVEAVMVGTTGGQGVSFLSRGIVIEGLGSLPQDGQGAGPRVGGPAP